MLRLILAMTCTVMVFGQSAGDDPPANPPADQPAASQPAAPPSALRNPAQADILKNLLNRRERPAPIRPRNDAAGTTGLDPRAVDAQGNPLLLEGTFLVERPGRLAYEQDAPVFVFRAGSDDSAIRTIQINPSQLLETMEREAQAGFEEFIISAEVVRYKEYNFLNIKKLLRRVKHGNLNP